MKQFKIVVGKHRDTYVAYPLGLKGVAGRPVTDARQRRERLSRLFRIRQDVRNLSRTWGATDLEGSPRNARKD